MRIHLRALLIIQTGNQIIDSNRHVRTRSPFHCTTIVVGENIDKSRFLLLFSLFLAEDRKRNSSLRIFHYPSLNGNAFVVVHVFVHGICGNPERVEGFFVDLVGMVHEVAPIVVVEGIGVV